MESVSKVKNQLVIKSEISNLNKHNIKSKNQNPSVFKTRKIELKLRKIDPEELHTTDL